jgi:hypothetical protein
MDSKKLVWRDGFFGSPKAPAAAAFFDFPEATREIGSWEQHRFGPFANENVFCFFKFSFIGPPKISGGNQE